MGFLSPKCLNDSYIDTDKEAAAEALSRHGLGFWAEMPDPFMSCEATSWLFFYFNHLRTATGIYPENFVKIRLELAEIYRI